MPIWLFDMIFKYKTTSYIFNFYGKIVCDLVFEDFQYGNSIKGNNIFWLDKDAIYWHLWKQSDTYKKVFDIIFEEHKELEGLLKKDLIAAKIGVGVGKTFNKSLKINKFKKFYLAEPNEFILDYIKDKYKSIHNIEFLNADIKELSNLQEFKCDILFSVGGVFMFEEREIVKDFFKSMHEKGLKYMIIVAEGTQENDDVVRDNTTTMYNFKKLLIEAGFKDKKFYMHNGDNYDSTKTLKYFIMC